MVLVFSGLLTVIDRRKKNEFNRPYFKVLEGINIDILTLILYQSPCLGFSLIT